MGNNADDMVAIPAEFWGNFGDDFVEERANPANPLERYRRYADGRMTYENWLAGNFRVKHPNGREEEVSGVMVNREELERCFPPPTNH